MDNVTVAVYKSKLLTIAERKVEERERDLCDALAALTSEEFHAYMERTR